jgi:UDP-glucuronate 4-epimerase
MSNILVTGSSGFIGFHLTKKLLECGYCVFGIDNHDPSYDQTLKEDRLDYLLNYSKSNNRNFTFFKKDICNYEELKKIFDKFEFNYIFNLAARAGVRNSIKDPHSYIESNVNGFLNILEFSKKQNVEHILYASSSSIYGMKDDKILTELDRTDSQVSLYGVTKKTNELMAETYSHLYGLSATGLRFFTVYGPYGRPDMAYYKFTKSIFNNNEIEVFNNGNLKRDFTYIDDIIESLIRLMPLSDFSNESSLYNSGTHHRILNIGNGNPIDLIEFINIIEQLCKKNANKKMLDMQIADVKTTHADTKNLYKLINFKPRTSIEEGLRKFVDWYISYYKIKL